MGNDETMRMVEDHAKRLAKLETGGEQTKEKINVWGAVNRNDLDDCYNNASLNLIRLKGLLDWAENLIGDRDVKDYEADATRGALQLMIEWLEDIIADFDQVEVARISLFDRFRRLRAVIAEGVFDGREALMVIKELNAEMNRAFNEDIPQLKKYHQELLEMDELIRESLNQPKTGRASAEPQIQAEAQGPEGPKTRK